MLRLPPPVRITRQEILESLARYSSVLVTYKFVSIYTGDPILIPTVSAGPNLCSSLPRRACIRFYDGTRWLREKMELPTVILVFSCEEMISELRTPGPNKSVRAVCMCKSVFWLTLFWRVGRHFGPFYVLGKETSCDTDADAID